MTSTISQSKRPLLMGNILPIVVGCRPKHMQTLNPLSYRKEPAVSHETRMPVHRVVVSRVIASIWPKPQKNGVLDYQVTFQRLYTTTQGDEDYAKSFYLLDLLCLAKAADQAHTWIMETKKENRQKANVSTRTRSSDEQSVPQDNGSQDVAPMRGT